LIIVTTFLCKGAFKPEKSMQYPEGQSTYLFSVSHVCMYGAMKVHSKKVCDEKVLNAGLLAGGRQIKTNIKLYFKTKHCK